MHFQMNSVELMTAYAKTFRAGPISTKIKPPSQAPKGFGDQGSAFKVSVLEVVLVALTVALLN